MKQNKKDKSAVTPNEIAIQARNESLPPSLDFGDPTGALTDIGTGRSSTILHEQSKKIQNKTIEDAPKLGEEPAP
ncbi:MAG: hypothetical protein B7Y39_02465 [Bdellovibrio sp. 28-41-41]|nr:MAG: hypothetical protein B7Y39_02465 [Bdellovibrio sp. 28-41-41]